MTKKALEKLNEKQKFHLEGLQEMYHHHFDDASSRLQEYLNGLRDAGIITETDRKCLFCYYTL